MQDTSDLQEGAKTEEPYTVLEQAGMAALFSLCYEASWKLVKETLEYHGLIPKRTGSPRHIIKMAYQAGMIEDCEAWLELLDARNLLAHAYGEQMSRDIIRKVRTVFLPLFENLKTTLDKQWLEEQ